MLVPVGTEGGREGGRRESMRTRRKRSDPHTQDASQSGTYIKAPSCSRVSMCFDVTGSYIILKQRRFAVFGCMCSRMRTYCHER